MMRKKLFLLHILSILTFGAVHAQQLSKYDRGSLVLKQDTMPYRILFPENFDPKSKYPLVIFLHGRDESGNDNELQLKNGGVLFLRDSIRKNYPAIVVFPQCSKSSYWSNVKIDTLASGKRNYTFRQDGPPTQAMSLLLKLVDNFLDKPYINSNQVYIGGISMGGMGAFEALYRKPKVFAASIVISGGANTATASKFAKRASVWIFHGRKDSILNPDLAIGMADVINTAGGDAKLTIYPTLGHNSWDKALSEPSLLYWLFSHTKK